MSVVPQGSVLGWLFTFLLQRVRSAYCSSLRCQQYADDAQLYMAIRPSDDEILKSFLILILNSSLARSLAGS